MRLTLSAAPADSTDDDVLLLLSVPIPIARCRELIEKLNAVGFRTNLGLKDAGVLLLLKAKGGGHYFGMLANVMYWSFCDVLLSHLETGASQLIIDGKIKLKNILDAPLTRFSASALHFADGSELRADAVICATGSVLCLGFIVSLSIDGADTHASQDWWRFGDDPRSLWGRGRRCVRADWGAR